MHSGYYEVSPTDLARGQCCWGRGTHRAGAAWGQGLGIHPASLGQTLSQRCSQSCPRTALSFTPRMSHEVQGQEERGCPAGQAKLVGRKLPSQARTWMLSPQTTWPQHHNGLGASGNQPCVGARGKGPADRCTSREDPHPPERPNLAWFSHTGL